MSVILDLIRDVETADADTRARLAKALRLDGHPFLADIEATQRNRMALEGTINVKTSRGPKLGEFLAPLAGELSGYTIILPERIARRDAIHAEMAALAGTDDTPGSRLWTLQRELDVVEQVISAIHTGKFSESGDLEERMRALGIPPRPGARSYFSRRLSLKRTTAAVETLTKEIEDNEKELAALREQLAAL